MAGINKDNDMRGKITAELIADAAEKLHVVHMLARDMPPNADFEIALSVLMTAFGEVSEDEKYDLVQEAARISTERVQSRERDRVRRSFSKN